MTRFLRLIPYAAATLATFFAIGAAGCTSAATSTRSDDEDGSPSPTSDEESANGETAIVVGVDGESFAEPYALGSVEIVARVAGKVVAKETREAANGPLFPHEIRVKPPEGSGRNAKLEIEVVGRSRHGASMGDEMSKVVTRTARASFTQGKAKLAYVFLEVRCNTLPLAGGDTISGPTCAAPTTCIAGACRPDDLGELPDYRADWAKNPPSACGTGAPEIEMLQGESTSEPLADGATLTVERGPQCGHHVWLGVRMKNIAQSGTTTILSATQPDTGKTVPATAFPYAYVATEGGRCELPGLRFQLDLAEVKIVELLGRPLDITVEAKDRAGRSAKTVRHVQIAPEARIETSRPCP